MVSFENGFAKLKFGTDLHMKVHNYYYYYSVSLTCKASPGEATLMHGGDSDNVPVLARICICCADKDIQDGVQPPF